MNNPKVMGVVQLFLGLAIPSIFLAIALPGNDSYTDAAGLSALFPWLIVVAPSSIALLIMGVYHLIKSELK
jgi:chromate transport protein ChrA